MTVFQEISVVCMIILAITIFNFIALLLIYARQISRQRQAERHEKQRHAETMKIIQYLDAIYKGLNQ